MLFRRYSTALTALLALLLLFPMPALACACCSNEGDYSIGFRKPSDYEFSMMKDIRFGKTAKLFSTEAGLEESAKGIAQAAESYVLRAALAGNVWKLSFRDGNRTGTLNLPLPAKMLSFKADIHDGKTSGGGGPLLYKEWRFEGVVTGGPGIFQSGIVPATKYFLVLQGRGNGCDDATDFSQWRLEITGKKARYAFYGELDSANAGSHHPKHTTTFGVGQYDQFHDVLHPLEHEALPKQDFPRIRVGAAQLIRLGEAIVRFGVPARTKAADDFENELKKFAQALKRFSLDAKAGSDEQLRMSYSAVHDSFEMLASMLPDKN